MKITQLVSPLHPVRARANKAIYSHVGSLSDGLVARGHDVRLFASSDSVTKANLRSVVTSFHDTELSEDERRLYMNLHTSRCYESARAENVDIIHSHFNLLASFFSNLVDTPTITSLHSPIDEKIRPFLAQTKGNRYVSFSLAQRKQMPELNWYANIYHGVDTNLFAFEPEPEEYLLYLGRITEEKGVHDAIAAAKAAGLPLCIAGTSYAKEGYWQKQIESQIDGVTVRYFGEASLEAKIPLLQKAKALLFPTRYNEVFGYVMIEAMSCGTPVIGFDNGSVPEIVQDGETGFVVSDVEGMVAAIKKLDTISRTAVRKRAERFFSVEKMVSGYEKVYKRLLEEVAFKRQKVEARSEASGC
jgi:glycosyltransferase involved in cell wall biosynthesis